MMVDMGVRAGTGSMAPADRGRARLPERSGTVERDGVGLAWEVYGDGPTTVLLLPTWSIISSRAWKAQVPYLARHHRVVTFDGRGSGRSSSPAGASAYTDTEYAADVLAVMDATGTEQAVLVAFSCGVSWALHVAAGRPERVQGVFAIAPACGVSCTRLEHEKQVWSTRPTPAEAATGAVQRYNKWVWLEGDFDAFRAWFFARMFHEPHSTKQLEDCLDWSASVTPGTLVATRAGSLGLDGAVRVPLEAVCPDVRCPVTVLHGTEDKIRSANVGREVAAATGGELVLVEGSGHGLPAREPVLVNTLLRDFVDRVAPGPGHGTPESPRTLVRAARRPRKVLYLSSPIGLGHAYRDLAVVQELRARRPDVQVDWLAQDPVTRVLELAGERVHPASSWLASESGQIEDEAGEHDLHAFQAIRRMDEILVNNYMVFDEVVRDDHYDLVVGDEAWDVDHFLHENPERKQAPYAWVTDFVGFLPMPDGGEDEARLTADHNAEMVEHLERFPWVRDRSVFVGERADVVPTSFGPGLPDIGEWTEQHFDFAGYVLGAAPPDSQLRARLRRSLGYRPEHRVCVVTVGGSGVGEQLLRRVLDAVPLARRLVPELRFLVVCGPRIDPSTLPRRTGVRVRGFVPRLAEHLAACDVALVQGGLTTCMELTAAGTPFVYVPLRHHFEQQFHVRHRLERYGAGHHLAYEDACDPDVLAEALVKELVGGSTALPVETGGAARAAGMLAELF